MTKLSDITSTGGTMLDPHMVSGNISTLNSTSHQLLAKYQHHYGSSLRLWCKALTLFADGNVLQIPLK